MASRWGSSISDLPDLEHAAAAALDDLSVESPSLVVAFVAGHPRSALDRLPHLIHQRFPRALLIGSSAGGVVGGGLEIEGRSAISITAASLPGVGLVPFHFEGDDDERLEPDALRRSSADADALIVLSDALGIDGALLVDALDDALPNVTKIGAIASGTSPRSGGALYLGEATHGSGAVGIAMRGVKVDAIVAQGCRPVGDAMFVTRHRALGESQSQSQSHSRRGHVIHELNGKPVAAVLRELLETLSPSDRVLYQSSLFLGVGFDDKREYKQGDFLIRSLTGLQGENAASQGLVVSADVEDFAVVQFHLRDAKASADELDALLRSAHSELAKPEGALVFSGLARGNGLYGAPNHESDAFHRELGAVPLGGAFGNCEIGPIRSDRARRTFVHEQSSCFALFRTT